MVDVHGGWGVWGGRLLTIHYTNTAQGIADFLGCFACHSKWERTVKKYYNTFEYRA